MDYEAMDKQMSSWVVTGTLYNTRFYLTSDGLFSDILSHARLFRWRDQAETQAQAEQTYECHWTWHVLSYPEAYVLD